MTSETKIAFSVFATLVAVIAGAFFFWRHSETTRPVLLEVRIVTATPTEPAFREGWRNLEPDEHVDIVCAIRLARPNEPPYWLAPVDVLMIDGEVVTHVQSDLWPENDRFVRAIWFTIESEFLGGDLTLENYTKNLDYRSFLAQEMGRELRAATAPSAHNNDYLGIPEGVISTDGGTIRLFVRVEVVDSLSHIKAFQAQSSPGAADLDSPFMVTLSRQTNFAEPIFDQAGEYFFLPCWQAENASVLDGIKAFRGQSFEELVEAHLAVSSSTLARIAASGSPDTGISSWQNLGSVNIADSTFSKHGRPLKFGKDINIGDILRIGDRWLVVSEDEGNGVLSSGDTMLSCWRAPATRRRLGPIIAPEMTSFEHLRFVRNP